MRLVACASGFLAFVACASAARAQHITVQQPSFEQFGVGTTVSAPDSGRGLAGSARRRGSAKSRFGRLPAGSNMNFAGQGGTFGVEVRVHETEERDLAARGLAEKARQSRDRTTLSPTAEHAYQALKSRGAARDLVRDTRANASRAASVAGRSDDGPSAEKLLDRARAAEAAGKHQLALSFLRVARDRGSAQAARELERSRPGPHQRSDREAP